MTAWLRHRPGSDSRRTLQGLGRIAVGLVMVAAALGLSRAFSEDGAGRPAATAEPRRVRGRHVAQGCGPARRGGHGRCPGPSAAPGQRGKPQRRVSQGAQPAAGTGSHASRPAAGSCGCAVEAPAAGRLGRRPGADREPSRGSAGTPAAHRRRLGPATHQRRCRCPAGTGVAVASGIEAAGQPQTARLPIEGLRIQQPQGITEEARVRRSPTVAQSPVEASPPTEATKRPDPEPIAVLRQPLFSAEPSVQRLPAQSPVIRTPIARIPVLLGPPAKSGRSRPRGPNAGRGNACCRTAGHPEASHAGGAGRPAAGHSAAADSNRGCAIAGRRRACRRDAVGPNAGRSTAALLKPLAEMPVVRASPVEQPAAEPPTVRPFWETETPVEPQGQVALISDYGPTGPVVGAAVQQGVKPLHLSLKFPASPSAAAPSRRRRSP